MDLFDLLFGAGPAVSVIFRLGFIPKEDEFFELTNQQYKEYFEVFDYTEEKVYMLLPNDREKYKAFAADEAFCLTESDKRSLKGGEAIIENYCAKSNKEFSSFHEKLCYVASMLPPVFSKDTPYARQPEN